jgi:ABC-type nitrate/sulfonate/bicarbonate transport system substrate-binding protein
MADFALRLALRRVGAGFGDIKAIQIGTSGPRLAALASKQIDFAVMTDAETLKATQLGLKVIMDLSALKVEFPASCQTALKKYVNENPKVVQSMLNAEAEAIHYFKTHKEETVKVMEKYTKGLEREILEQSWDVYSKLLVEDMVPRGLQGVLDVTAASNPKAVGAKAEDFVDLRFVDELKKSGFLDKLYGRR